MNVAGEIERAQEIKSKADKLEASERDKCMRMLMNEVEKKEDRIRD